MCMFDKIDQEVTRVKLLLAYLEDDLDDTVDFMSTEFSPDNKMALDLKAAMYDKYTSLRNALLTVQRVGDARADIIEAAADMETSRREPEEVLDLISRVCKTWDLPAPAVSL